LIGYRLKNFPVILISPGWLGVVGLCVLLFIFDVKRRINPIEVIFQFQNGIRFEFFSRV